MNSSKDKKQAGSTHSNPSPNSQQKKEASPQPAAPQLKNFIHDIIDEHAKSGRFGGRVHTRFPPEPNGYLHIGHAKSICLNFGIALKYNGQCNLRFDDTNPLAEDVEFIEAIKEDIRWLGFTWDEIHHASDYFDQLYEFAVTLIKNGKAYVCSLNEEQVREGRGNLTTPGKNSPYRERSIAENLDLFARMRAGDFPNGAHTLRAKIDMSSGNMNLRDPLLYRIRHVPHPVTGDKWCIYPLYDFTHCLSDELEEITHSICTLEFEDHRPLYDWILDELKTPVHPQQIEFSKLVISYFTFSKRNYVLQDLIRGEVVFPSDMVGDFVLIRSSGMPVYNFCCVVDDALMKISHVLRAEEHLSNTLRQMMIYEALGFELPAFGHLSIILGPDKQKLSKRHGATSCREYRDRGYLPEALNNFMALLGWSSPQGQEILSLDEMIAQITLDRFTPSPAVFDETKLKWVNATHLRALSHSELWHRLSPFLEKAGLTFASDKEWQERALSLMKSYMETLEDGIELFRPLAKDGWEILPEAKEVLSWESSARVVSEWLNLLQSTSATYLSELDFLAIQDQVKEKCGVKGKFLFMPIRVAVLGKPHGAELKILVPLIEKSLLCERGEKVLKLVGEGISN